MPLQCVMTGATQGIGLQAALRLAGPGRNLVVAARTPAAAPAPLRAVASFATVDLASLADVRALAARLLQGPQIDRLVLSAGVQSLGGATSADGYDLAFAVNHLAHYLLARLLLPHMAPDGRIIFTSSGTHDPAEKTGLPAPVHADAALLADPARDPRRPAGRMRAGQYAYSASKLCNVMTARTLAQNIAASRPDIAVAAFDPGFTPGTGLTRDYAAPIGFVFRRVLPLILPKSGRVSTPLNSGSKLAVLALDGAYGSTRGGYFAVRGKDLVETAPSALARDAAAADRLWADSAAMVGLGVA